MNRSSSAAALALLAGLLAAPAARAEAQITAGLAPPAPARVVAERVAAESVVVAVRDSIAEAERLDMRAWVDSAARSLEAGGAPVTPMPDVPGDSLVADAATPAAVPPAPVPPAPSGAPTVRYREGAPAPDTATPLPALVLLAGGLLGGGAALLRRR